MVASRGEWAKSLENSSFMQVEGNIMTVNPASDALKRFTVLDLTRVRAGPTCVRQLADWGANVIKIELPEAMDGGNALGGARHGPDFMNLHRNKRAMTLNLKNEKGVELLKRLVRTADVIVENYRPDVKQRLGIDYDALSKENPKLVYASTVSYTHLRAHETS